MVRTFKTKLVPSITFVFKYRWGKKYGYRVHSLIVENRHGESEDTNTHNVPNETIQKMKKQV